MEESLHHFAATGNGQAILDLLKAKKISNVDSFDDNGNTALILAAYSNSYFCVKILLENKASPTICRKSGTSALFFAAQNGNIQIVKLLLQYKARINSQNVKSFCVEKFVATWCWCIN